MLKESFLKDVDIDEDRQRGGEALSCQAVFQAQGIYNSKLTMDEMACDWHKTCMVYMMINKLIKVVMDRCSSSKPRWHLRRLAAIRVTSLCSHLAQWVLLFQKLCLQNQDFLPSYPLAHR